MTNIQRLALVLVFASVGCGHASPLAPQPLPERLRLALAGQSNAIYLQPFLQKAADVKAFYGEVQPIDCWSATGACWTALKPQLHQPLDAFIWSQGEADILAQTPGYGTPHPGYRAAFAALIARVRQEAGNPNLLVVVMQKGQWAASWADKGITVDADLAAWVTVDAHALILPTRDLEWRTDAIHMTDQGYTDATARLVSTIRSKLGR